MDTQCREFIEAKIHTQQYAAAADFIFQNIEKHQNEEYFVLLYILFQIRKEELHAGEQDIFTTLQCPDIDTLILHYTNIKFCLRRFEYDVGEAARQEAFQYFVDFSLSPYALYHIAKFACIDKTSVLQRIAKRYMALGKKSFAETLQNLSER